MTLLPLVLAAVLVACYAPFAFAQQALMPAFDHRKLIADNLSTMFSPDAHVRNVLVSEMRRIQSPVGLTWAACVRLAATSMTGKPTVPRTYVVTFTALNKIAERREARSADCADAKFQPLK